MRPDSTGSDEGGLPSSPGRETDGSVARVGQVVRLLPQHRDDYIALHEAVWPAVRTMISDCNIKNYSIFERDGLLFACFEYAGHDWNADNAKMMADPTTREWWKLTDPCQQPVHGHDGPRPWASMTEVFHHD
ncbi:L-rhamnose mutarotase [Candidatus Poriferisocius sp.]|uniref:L-rhamnose mutarotase n=1 Tax=Candidatus Poriferisocius sp. TaxID=3101276 RepID=UPI003B02B0C1